MSPAAAVRRHVTGTPYDLLAAFLGMRPDRARGIVARWRRAGLVSK
jgi:hypothetical protein